MSEAAFARHREVSRQAVMYWKRRGNIVMKNGLVDVAVSDRMLNERPGKWYGGTTSKRVES